MGKKPEKEMYLWRDLNFPNSMNMNTFNPPEVDISIFGQAFPSRIQVILFTKLQVGVP